MKFERFYAGQSPALVSAPEVHIRKRSLGFTSALMSYFPDAVAVALFWEPDAKCIGFKFLSKRERGDYALRAQVGKRTRYVFCDLFFKKYGLSEHQGDFEPVMVPGSSDIDCFIALVNAPSVSTSPKPGDADGKVESPAEVMDRVLTPEPAAIEGERSIAEHVRAIRPWNKPYSVSQAIQVAESRQDLAVIARSAGVTVVQAKEIRDCWGSADGIADLKKRRDS